MSSEDAMSAENNEKILISIQESRAFCFLIRFYIKLTAA